MTFLNSLFDFMIEAVNSHRGIINRFLGDSFMAVFGAPISDAQNCQHALDATLEILDRLAASNREWGETGRIGTELHAGGATTGKVGSRRRKEYTIIGDTVNVAARIEQLNRSLGSQHPFSDSVLRSLEMEPSASLPLDGLSVKGHEEPLNLYRLG